MSIGIFTDKKHQPSWEEVQAVVGARWSDWLALAKIIREQYPVVEDFKFMYGKKYGWALRFQTSKKLLVSLYPTEGSFTVQINLPEAAVQRALMMGIGEAMQQAINAAYPYPEGRWIFIPLREDANLEDIRRLIDLRVETRLGGKVKQETV